MVEWMDSCEAIGHRVLSVSSANGYLDEGRRYCRETEQQTVCD